MLSLPWPELGSTGKFQPGHCSVPRLTTPGPPGASASLGWPHPALTPPCKAPSWPRCSRAYFHFLLPALQALQPLEVLLAFHCGETALCLGSVMSQGLGFTAKGLQTRGHLCHLGGQEEGDESQCRCSRWEGWGHPPVATLIPFVPHRDESRCIPHPNLVARPAVGGQPRWHPSALKPSPLPGAPGFPSPLPPPQPAHAPSSHCSASPRPPAALPKDCSPPCYLQTGQTMGEKPPASHDACSLAEAKKHWVSEVGSDPLSSQAGEGPPRVSLPATDQPLG